MSARGESGVALILVILVVSFLSAAGIGLMLVLFMEQLASANYRGSIALLYAADAGIELAARDLARSTDWTAVLTGIERGGFTDGPPDGPRGLPGGGLVDLTAETHLLNCGRLITCTAAQMDAISRERPWGANNPRWRLYDYGPLPSLFVRPVPGYLAVWVADDGRETDDDPSADAEAGERGWGVVRVRATAYGLHGARRAVEAELMAVCTGDGAEATCLPGIRVHSWQEVRHVVP